HLRAARGNCSDEAGIEPAGKQQPNWHIRNQMLCSDFVERLIQLYLQVIRLDRRVGGDLRKKVALELRLFVWTYAEEMARRKLADAVENGAVTFERIAKFQKLSDRVPIDRRYKIRELEKGLQLRRKHNPAFERLPIIKWLDAHWIAKQK